MNRWLKLFCVLLTINSFAQEDSLMKIHAVNSSDRHALSPESGAMIYDTTNESLYYYTGVFWKRIRKNVRSTYETIPLSSGNQTVNVVNADKIIGFTLISSYNSLLLEKWQKHL